MATYGPNKILSKHYFHPRTRYLSVAPEAVNEDHRAHAPPPLIYLAAFALGAVAHFVWPLASVSPVFRLLGAAMMAAGFYISYSGVREMKRVGTTPRPSDKALRLIV